MSLVEEQLPRYRLKQDYIAQCGGPRHEDWTLHTPALTPAPTQLSPEQAGAALDYFVSCGARLTHTACPALPSPVLTPRARDCPAP